MPPLMDLRSLPRVIEELSETLRSLCSLRRPQSGGISFQRGDEEFSSARFGTPSTSRASYNQQETLGNFLSRATACICTIEENGFELRESARLAVFAALFGLPAGSDTLTHAERTQERDDGYSNRGLLRAVADTALVEQPPTFLTAKRKALEVCATAVATFGGASLPVDVIPAVEVRLISGLTGLPGEACPGDRGK